MNIRSHSSRSQGSSSGGQTSTFTSEMSLCCSVIEFLPQPSSKKQHTRENNSPQHAFEEDQLNLNDGTQIDQDSLDSDTNHLQRHTERYLSYYESLPLELRWLRESSYLSALFDLQYERERLFIYSERWSENFNTIMKLRIANRLIFQEEELIQLTFELLNGLQQLQQIAVHVLNQGLTPQTLQEPSELLFLDPLNIAFIALKRQKSTVVNYKITNFLDFILMNSNSTKRKYLLEQIFNTDEALYYMPPELLLQLFVQKKQLPAQQPIDLEFEEEIPEFKEEEEKQFMTCMYRGPIWSIGILLLRCVHQRQGDFLAQHYQKLQGKLQYINDLIRNCKSDTLFDTIPNTEDEQTPFQKWIQGTNCPVDEFSWSFRDLLRQMLCPNVSKRATVNDLLDNPIFDGYQSTLSDHHNHEPISLGVFANLTKQDLNQQVSDQFFSNDEIVSLSQPILRRRVPQTNGQTIKSVQFNFSSLRQVYSTKINQICSMVRQEGVQKLQVDQFLERIARIASLAPQKKTDEDQLSIKSDIMGSKRQSIQANPQFSQDDSAQKQNQLSTGMLSRMNIFSKVGGGMFSQKSKRSDSPKEQAQLDNESQSTASEPQALNVTQFTQMIAQLLLMKLVASSSERLFKAFLAKNKEFINMGVRGAFWRGIRKQLWPRALDIQNEEAQREIIDLTLEVGYCTLQIKWNDQIQFEKDIIRCHQCNNFANSYHGKLLIAKTLRAFINIQQFNFYLQGMDAMTLVFLEAMDYDWRLAVVCLQELFNKKIVDKDLLQSDSKVPIAEQFRHAFDQKLLDKVVLYKWIITFEDPQLWAHLETNNFHPEMHVVSWFTNFFAQDFEVQNVIRIWDYLFLQEEYFEVFFAVAIMSELRETLMLKDETGMSSCIKNLQSIISTELCLKFAQQVQNKIPKSFTMLYYTTPDVQKDYHEKDNQFVKDRPWENPPTFEQLKERRTFYISVQDLQAIQSKESYASYLFMLDFRPLKSFESECIIGSVYANYQNGKINSQHLLRYLQLKNEKVSSSFEQFKEEQEAQQQLFNKKTQSLKAFGFVVIVWDYQTQQAEIDKIQSYMLDVVMCRRLCVLKGGIQSVRIDAENMIQRKGIKSVLPIFIKRELDDFK